MNMTVTLASSALMWKWRRGGFLVLLSLAAMAPTPAQAASSAAQSASGVGVSTVPPSPAAVRFRGEPVTLNFVNAEIEGVARAMGAILKQQFVVDPRVKGPITLYSETPLSPADAYRNFLAALRGVGFTVVEVAGLFKVVPEADAKLQSGTVVVGEATRRGDQILTQIFKLAHENANNLVPVLRPLISPNNTINANPGNNTLIITDYADNLQRIERIIAAMDTPAAGDVEVIPLQYAVAADTAALIQRLTDTGSAAAVPGGSGPAATILVDARSNALLVRAPNPARMASIKSLVEKLDRPTAGSGSAGNIWVVYLKHADAVRLATVLRAAFANTSGGGTGGTSTSALPTASTPTTPTTPGATGASVQATTPVSSAAQPSTGGFIQADPSTNSLIITAPEPLYRQLRAAIDQLDARRAMVHIESIIVKIDAAKAAEFGFQWQGALGVKGDSNVLVGGTNFTVGGTSGNNILTLSSSTVGSAIPGAGLNLGLAHKFGSVYSLGALARFLESNTDANVLSTPELTMLDNEEGKIVIGQNVPFITGTFTNTGSTGGSTNPFQTIERKDVGLTLRVKPQIGEGGVVRLTLYQENSNVVAGTSTASAGPTTDKSAIETSVVVEDGGVIVLGGLLRDEYSGGADKLPGLGDIPLIGNLFRTDNRKRTKSNLMVFLRPVVIRDQAASDSLTVDRYERIRALQQDAQPKPSYTVPVNQAPLVPALEPRAAKPAASGASAPTR